MRRLLAAIIVAAAVLGCGSVTGRPWVHASPSHARTFAACVSGDCGPNAIQLQWGNLQYPATTGYYLTANGTQVGTAVASPYTFYGMDCGTTFTLGVQAHNATGGTSPVYSTSYTTASCGGGGGGSGSSVLPYDPSSPWNQTITTAGATVDASSSSYIGRLSAIGKPLTSDTTQNTPDVVLINSATQANQVVLDSNAIYGYGGGSWHEYQAGDNNSLGGAALVGHSPPAGLINVPIPNGAADPGPGFGPDTAGNYTDNQVIVWDPSSGFELDCWLWDPGSVFSGGVTPATANSTGPTNGLTSTTGGNCSNAWETYTKSETFSGTSYRYYGLMGDGAAGRGAGTPYLAGLVRPWEIAQGHIDHAIAWAYTSPTSAHVYPAQKSDGSGANTGDMPEGSRLVLDPTLTCTSYNPATTAPSGVPCAAGSQINTLCSTSNNPRACMIIAVALQTYGAFEIDNSGSTKLYLEADSTASPSWSSLGISSTTSVVSPLTPGNSFSHFFIYDTPCPSGVCNP